MKNQTEDFAKARPPIGNAVKPSASGADLADAVSDKLIDAHGHLRAISNNLSEIIQIWGGLKDPPEAFARLQKHVKMGQNALNYFIDQFEETGFCKP